MSDIAHTLSREAEAARTLLLNIKDVIGDDEQAAQDAIEGETNFIEAAASAVERLALLNAHCDALKSTQGRLAARMSRLESQSDSIRAALAVAMATAGQTKIEVALATITRKAVPPKLIVLDESAIPPEFWKRSDPKLDRAAVSRALRDERDVPGATLSNGGETIQIRWA
mgnify:CR=1 FL=1